MKWWRIVVRYQRFGGTCYLNFQGRRISRDVPFCLFFFLLVYFSFFHFILLFIFVFSFITSFTLFLSILEPRYFPLTPPLLRYSLFRAFLIPLYIFTSFLAALNYHFCKPRLSFTLKYIKNFLLNFFSLFLSVIFQHHHPNLLLSRTNEREENVVNQHN